MTSQLYILTLWSFLCFFLGMACAVLLYHYYIGAVIKKAERLIEQMGHRPFNPPQGKESP